MNDADAEYDARPRRRWAALLLSLPVPGLGQLYAGYPRRALIFYCLPFLLVPCLFGFLSLHSLAPLPLAGVFALSISVTVLGPVDAFLVARGQSPSYRLRRYNRWYIYAACVVVQSFVSPLIVEQLVAFGRVSVQAFALTTGSMEDTLLLGDYLLVDNLAYGLRLPGHESESRSWADPGRGEMVTLRYPLDRSRVFVKRVVGLPGERIEMRAGVVIVDGRPLPEPYAKHVESKAPPPVHAAQEDFLVTSWGPETIPTGQYFLLGDNRDRSMDSRHFGSVPRADILGRVRSIYWSVERNTGSVLPARVRWDRIGRKLRNEQ